MLNFTGYSDNLIIMKVLRKQVFILVLFITVFQLPGINAQAPFKNGTTINAVLDIGFPDSLSASKNGYINTWAGGDSLDLFELSWFDTVIVKISSAQELNLVLKSFVAGKFSGEGFRSYDLQLTDTLIGSLPGFFISGKTDDKLQDIRKFDCFVTIANSNSYWFFYYVSSPSVPTEKAGRFFSSIQFNRNKIKEAAFRMSSFKKHKPAGQTWYLSPELDYPMPPKEKKKESPGKPSYPPLPPPPPIDRKWVVQATKLASDYNLNRSMADRKYKKGQGSVIVEGIVKEIRDADEYSTTIILDGGSSPIDIQCESIRTSKLKNLRKGMKATLSGHCEGINGNVILSGCLYIDKPAYE